MIKLDMRDIGLPKECLILVGRVYNHPNTNKHTKDFVRFELQRILGQEYDVKQFLNSNECKIK